MACLLPPNRQPVISNAHRKENGQPNQFVKKVILSEDIVVAVLLFSQYFPHSGHRRGLGEGACSYRSNYADQVRNGVFSASPPVDFLRSAVFSLMKLIEKSDVKSIGEIY